VSGAEARWEHFRHGADIGVRGLGPTREQAFEQAALALAAVVAEPARIGAVESVELSCAAPDAELLLVDFLNALVYQMATRRLLFGRVEVRMQQTADTLRLEARAWGEGVDVARHEPAVEVKGATMTALAVGPRPDGGWLAQCVVDV
jgi:SHS2 domain-containing protein